jgi:hypothetical protein
VSGSTLGSSKFSLSSCLRVTMLELACKGQRTGANMLGSPCRDQLVRLYRSGCPVACTIKVLQL